jgi:hypothetical protein
VPVLDQLVWRSDPHEAECNPLVCRHERALVVHGADRREEIVGEGELQGTVDLVEEDHCWRIGGPGNDVAEEAHKLLIIRFTGDALLPVDDVDAELEVAGDLVDQTFVIAFDLPRSADRGQIDVGRAHTPVVQPVDGADHEAGLTGLAGCQHVGALPIDQEIKKLAVFRPIGTKLVNNLRQCGQEVVAALPSSGVNTITGEGLTKALTDAQVLVDVSNAPSWDDKAVLEFFETSGRNLLAAEATAGVGHHVALSVVGTDRLLASGYFRAKTAQENLIKASKIPFTIVRATQFFEFVGGIAQFSTEGATVRLPSALMQPIVSDDVAAVLADVAIARTIERYGRGSRSRIDQNG